jgi:hypothetical protein
MNEFQEGGRKFDFMRGGQKILIKDNLEGMADGFFIECYQNH